MNRISDYVRATLVRGGFTCALANVPRLQGGFSEVMQAQKGDRTFLVYLQCQSCSGSAEEKLAMKYLQALRGDTPAFVLWFGNGFTDGLIQYFENQPSEQSFLGCLSIEKFCTMALEGKL